MKAEPTDAELAKVELNESFRETTRLLDVLVELSAADAESMAMVTAYVDGAQAVLRAGLLAMGKLHNGG